LEKPVKSKPLPSGGSGAPSGPSSALLVLATMSGSSTAWREK
jgi:hypothetical protein